MSKYTIEYKSNVDSTWCVSAGNDSAFDDRRLFLELLDIITNTAKHSAPLVYRLVDDKGNHVNLCDVYYTLELESTPPQIDAEYWAVMDEHDRAVITGDPIFDTKNAAEQALTLLRRYVLAPELARMVVRRVAPAQTFAVIG